MSGARAISDEDWAVLFEARHELVRLFGRMSRLPADVVEDCVSQALIDVAADFDPVAIATEANHIQVKRGTIIAGRVRAAAQKRLDQEKYRASKLVSDDTPIGEEDSEMHLRDLFVGRACSAERIENYAEWKMFSRRGGCPLTSEEIDDLFGVRGGA